MNPDLLDFKQLCARYPFRPWTIRSYCSQGKIPYIKVGKKVFFRVSEIERWLNAHQKPAMSHASGESDVCP
jgi:hypothetical protein